MKKTIAMLLAIIMAVGLLAGCNNNKPADTKTTGDTMNTNQETVDPSKLDPFRVAMITPLSGGFAYCGNEYLGGFRCAFDVYNNEINGRKIEVVTADGYDFDSQLAEFERLTADGITVFGGGCAQFVETALASMVDQMEVLYLAGNWDHTIIQGESRFFNQPIQTTADFAVDLANKCAEIAKDFLNISEPSNLKIAFVHGNLNEQLVKPFRDQCKKLGIQIVIDEGYPDDQKDFTAIISKMQNTEYDIFVPMQGGADGSLFLTKLYEMNAKPAVTLAGGSFYDTAGFADLGDNITNGIMTLTYPNPLMLKDFMPSMQDFYDRFVEKMGHEPLAHALLGFGFGTMIAETLKMTPPEKWEDTGLLADNLRKLDYDYGKFPGWYWGIQMDSSGRNLRSSVSAVNQWVDGKPVCIYPEEMALGEPNIPWKK